MKMKIELRNCLWLLSMTVFLVCFCNSVQAQIGGWNPELETKAREAIKMFKEKDPELENFFEEAYGYAVFPEVGKGAVGIGGAHGSGIVFQADAAIGRVTLTQVTVGFQLGGQVYSELIFFEDEKAMKRFKRGKLKFAGQVSAVAVTLGASANVAYQNGVAVFTMTKGGLMYEASVGGQKFKYRAMEDN
ncbi:lipid-binding SYLF domain-containing protein [Maribacter aestuarii]|uniref:lipid-binding SYLF domain-containing protein n=1 Tax=Maribacter aestuarii TaxID=1130723 RepID=UPI00248CA4BC|nr:lipid-binding SYLF domain-containing protein [Maribacter aestuarii]